MPPVLYRLQDLRFAYGSTPVLNGISTQFAAGEFIAFVGPNGAGKSTLMKILAGLFREYQGSVEFAGKPLTDYKSKQIARQLALVPQETHVLFPFTVGEIIMMGRLPHRTSGLFETPRDVERAREAMELTETAALSAKTFQQLSGGERQRVILASALAQDPEVLLLDEPTVYLDLKHQVQFYGIVERLNHERGMTIISVTHDVNLAARYARRMVALREGRIFADGTPDEVLTAQNLYDIFEIAAAVHKRPDGRGPYVIPAG